MNALTATSAGRAEHGNEDFVAATERAMVVVDGAGIRGGAALCEHGVAWYSHSLGTDLLARLTTHPTVLLREALGDSIAAVTAMHSDTCHVADPSSPQASVAVARRSGSDLDWLVLGDAYVIAEAEEPLVVNDEREVDVRSAATRRLEGLTPGSPEHDRQTHVAIETLRARRNQPGGYWIAKDDPHAALHAIVGRQGIQPDARVAVLSNGVARLVDPYRVTDWRGLFMMLRDVGPDGVLQRLRAVERETAVRPDDASIGYWRPSH